MLNKNYTIVGVVILAMAAGAIFWSRNDSSTPDASTLGRGVKNLTRASAAKMIEKRLTTNPQGWWDGLYEGKTQKFRYDKSGGHYEMNRWETGISKAKMKELETTGFIKIVAINERDVESAFHRITFDFTEQANPYFVKQKNTSPEDKDILLLLGEVADVEVTGLTEPAMKNGANTRTAAYIAKYKATPIGKIIDEKKATQEISAMWQFTLYDDGWRIGQ